MYFFSLLEIVSKSVSKSGELHVLNVSKTTYESLKVLIIKSKHTHTKKTYVFSKTLHLVRL